MAANSLLSMVQEFCARTGIPKPTSVAGSLDHQVLQAQALMNEVLEEMVDRWTWEDLILEGTFTTVNGMDQGKISTFAPKGFRRILNDTIWDRTSRMPICGPLSPSDWQTAKAMTSSGGPQTTYRIRNNHMLFLPDGVAGHSCYFEYQSEYAILAVDGTTTKDMWTVDTDSCILDPKLVVQGLRWKWKYEKGLEYAEDKNRWEEACANAAGRSGTRATLSMNAADYYEDRMNGPRLVIPPGGYSVPVP